MTAAVFPVGAATGIGSLPGRDASEAARTVAGELADLPHLVELPERGVGADLIGRGIGMLVDLYAEVMPSGWRITRRPGRDVQRALDYLAWDIDAAEQHYAGASTVKLQVCGPWTLAAGVEVPSGNRALLDSGATRDLAESLAEGVRRQVGELRARLPGARLVVQVDEPSLPAVLRGSLPTASGFGTVPALEADVAERLLADFLDGLPAGVFPVAHCCHPDVPLRLLRTAGFAGLSFDLPAVAGDTIRLDMIGEAVEDGAVLFAGLVPSTDPAGRPTLLNLATPLLEMWRRLGFPRTSLADVIPTPTCGLAGASPDWARRAMTLCRELGQALQDPPQGWGASA